MTNEREARRADNKLIADEIRALREALNLSQEELARTLDVSVRSVARWECGDRAPDKRATKALRRLAGKRTAA